MDPICIKLRIPKSVPAREDLAWRVVAFAWFLHFCAQLKSTKLADPAKFTEFLWTYHRILSGTLLEKK